jgi:hypothetical protein
MFFHILSSRIVDSDLQLIFFFLTSSMDSLNDIYIYIYEADFKCTEKQLILHFYGRVDRQRINLYKKLIGSIDLIAL